MFLLDTNIISELRKGKPKQSAAVRAWAAKVPASQLYLSAVTMLELEIGVLRMERKDAKQGAVLRNWLTQIRQQFATQMLPFSAEAAAICGAMHVPDPCSFRDSMIAASALQHGLTLVTRNTADFEGLQVPLLNPF